MVGPGDWRFVATRKLRCGFVVRKNQLHSEPVIAHFKPVAAVAGKENSNVPSGEAAQNATTRATFSDIKPANLSAIVERKANSDIGAA